MCIQQICRQCGKEIDHRSKRCHSCEAKQRIKEAHNPFRNEKTRFKKEEYDKRLDLQFPNTAKEKRRIRSSDNTWFAYWCGKDFFKKYVIHHEWENGAYCRLLTYKEHIEIHKRRKLNGF